VLETTNKQRTELEREVSEVKRSLAQERDQLQIKSQEVDCLRKSESDLRSQISILSQKLKDLEASVSAASAASAAATSSTSSHFHSHSHSHSHISHPAVSTQVATPLPPQEDNSLTSLSTSYYLFTPQCMLTEDPNSQARHAGLRKLISSLNEAVGILVVYFGSNNVPQEGNSPPLPFSSSSALFLAFLLLLLLLLLLPLVLFPFSSTFLFLL
jgi:hypothetical protein